MNELFRYGLASAIDARAAASNVWESAGFSDQNLFGSLRPPWLLSYSPQHNACAANGLAAQGKRRGHTDQGKFVTRVITHLEIVRMAGIGRRREVNRGNQLIRLQVRIHFRSVTGQPVKIADGQRAFSMPAPDPNGGFEGSQRDTHVRWMYGNALFAGSENGVGPV